MRFFCSISLLVLVSIVLIRFALTRPVAVSFLALVRETLPLIPTLKYNAKSKGMKSVAVSELLENQCSVDNLSIYSAAPPTMISACHEFIGEYDEDLIEVLASAPKDESSTRQAFCGQFCRQAELFENNESMEKAYKAHLATRQTKKDSVLKAQRAARGEL